MSSTRCANEIISSLYQSLTHAFTVLQLTSMKSDERHYMRWWNDGWKTYHQGLKVTVNDSHMFNVQVTSSKFIDK